MNKKLVRKKGPSQNLPGLPKVNNPNAMLSQMQQMQSDMAKAQEELEHEYLTITAGGGAVTVEISGQQRIKSIKLDPEILNPDDAEVIQEMLTTAVNQAIEQSQALSAKRMEEISSGVRGLNDMLSSMGISL
jgi:DNA-binding YbaB/EbfC family protein